MHNLKFVTTSWDDGDVRDVRIAELLRSRGLTGTFYVPIQAYKGIRSLSNCDLRTLRSEGFEIGAHSVSHKDLSRIDEEGLAHEVRDCKQILEQLLGEHVRMFCYPNGRYNASVIRQVQAAGYLGARTTQMLSIGTDFGPFKMPTTIQAYPHSRLAYTKNLARAKNIAGIMRCRGQSWWQKPWVDVGKQMFQYVLEHGGVWHLYGHSWEVDELGIWSDLAELLNYVCHREDVAYITNGELLSLGVVSDGGPTY
jgi:peptidoglycan-N-acetylglucosamine deacetylase